MPENPDRPKGRRLAIHFAVIPALSPTPLSDPVAALAGGPGESTIGAAAYYATRLALLRRNRDLLLVDQRGTGRSAPLICHLFLPNNPAENLRDVFPLSAVTSCVRRLQGSADLARYTYSYFARDLEQVRRALGYGALNLYAGSYGTRAAQVYVRTYPGSVRTVYMGSVVPIDAATPLTFAKAGQAKLQRMIENCESDARCHTAFPNLQREFRQVLERLASGSVRVVVPNGTRRVPLSRGRVTEWVRSQLSRPHDEAVLPWTIHRAWSGDWKPIVDGILSDARDADGDLSWGLFFSITCSEDVPFIREQDVVRETRDTFLGDYRIREQQAACARWPKAALPGGYRRRVQSSVPTLFVRHPPGLPSPSHAVFTSTSSS